MARISRYLSQDKLEFIMKTFMQSQFNYCPLVWMFCSRTLDDKINKLHERPLRLVYKNENLTFDELLDLDNSVTVHISPIPMQELFTEQIISYDLRIKRCWQVPNARTVNNGLESIRYRGPKLWVSLPTTIKESKTFAEFKIKIKTWKEANCTCRLCKTYITNLGFMIDGLYF